jgi:hypothetical protein
MQEFIYLLSLSSVVRVPLDELAQWFAEKNRVSVPQAMERLEQLSQDCAYLGRLRLFIAKGSVVAIDKVTVCSAATPVSLPVADYYVLPVQESHILITGREVHTAEAS